MYNSISMFVTIYAQYYSLWNYIDIIVTKIRKCFFVTSFMKCHEILLFVMTKGVAYHEKIRLLIKFLHHAPRKFTRFFCLIIFIIHTQLFFGNFWGSFVRNWLVGRPFNGLSIKNLIFPVDIPLKFACF